MTGLTENNMDYTTAPVYIFLLGDLRTNVGLPMFIRYDESNRQMLYYSSLANAFMYMHLTATTLGIVTRWASITHTGYVHSMIKQLLKISDELEMLDMIALGYPEMEPRPTLMRNSEEIIRYDDCGPDDFRSLEEVMEFAKRAGNWNIGSHSRGSDKSGKQ